MVGGAASVKNANNEKVYYPYYRCSNRYGPLANGCDQPNLKKEDVDDLVWNWLENLLQDEWALDEGLDQLEKDAKDKLEPKKKHLETVLALLAKMEVKIAKLVDAFAEMEDATVAKAIQEQIKFAVDQKESLIHEKEEVESEIESIEVTPQTRKQIKLIAKSIREKLPGASNKDKQKLLDTIGLHGILTHLENGQLAIEVSCVLDTRIFCMETQDSWRWSRSRHGWGRQSSRRGRGFARLRA